MGYCCSAVTDTTLVSNVFADRKQRSLHDHIAMIAKDTPDANPRPSPDPALVDR